MRSRVIRITLKVPNCIVKPGIARYPRPARGMCPRIGQTIRPGETVQFPTRFQGSLRFMPWHDVSCVE